MEFFRKGFGRNIHNTKLTMNMTALPNVVLFSCILALTGCDRKRSLQQPITDSTSGSPASRQIAADDYASLLILQTKDGRPDWGPTESFLAEIAAPTHGESPALAYFRDNLNLLFRNGVLERFFGASSQTLNAAVQNPEFLRLIHKVYADERDEHRFWSAGVEMLKCSKDKSFAPELFSDWKRLPPADLVNPRTRNDQNAFATAPRKMMADAIFSLDNKDVIAEVWRSFPSMSESDQIVMLTSSSGYPSFYTLKNVLVLAELSDTGRGEAVLGMLARWPSLIMMKLLDQQPTGERPTLVGELADILTVMERKRLVTSELAEALRDVKR